MLPASQHLFQTGSCSCRRQGSSTSLRHRLSDIWPREWMCCCLKQVWLACVERKTESNHPTYFVRNTTRDTVVNSRFYLYKFLQPVSACQTHFAAASAATHLCSRNHLCLAECSTPRPRDMSILFRNK